MDRYNDDGYFFKTTAELCKSLSPPENSKYWDAMDKCKPCTLVSGCGFCRSTMKCMLGDKLGPLVPGGEGTENGFANGGDGGAVSLFGGGSKGQTPGDHGGSVGIEGGFAKKGRGGDLTMISGYSEGTNSGSVTLATANAGFKGTSSFLALSTGSSTKGDSGEITMTTGDAIEGHGGYMMLQVGKGTRYGGGDVTRGVDYDDNWQVIENFKRQRFDSNTEFGHGRIFRVIYVYFWSCNGCGFWWNDFHYWDI
uniref:Peptidase S74 domain-containing protein n=1 Tax=Globisporangium ultimum (strain ATCC 200006 / CBS 805.95 / DAOM BR144) TaxID=431595 RepID=K3X8I9_GLOUD